MPRGDPPKGNEEVGVTCDDEGVSEIENGANKDERKRTSRGKENGVG